MTVLYEDVAGSFSNLRSFLLNDLDLVVTQPIGGNYAAVLLVTSACEAVGRLRYGKRSGGELFFSEYMLPTNWQPVGVYLFNALRNGLAHSYDTKTLVQIGDRAIDVVISRRDKPHLAFEAADSRLFVNAADLTAQLKAALDRYDEELKQSGPLRDRFIKWIKREATVDVVKAVDRRAWRQLLGIDDISAT